MERDGESSSFIVPREMFCNSLLTKRKTADVEISWFFNMKYQEQSERGQYTLVALK